LLGGFVELIPQPTGCRLKLLAQPDDWDLRLIIAICNQNPKKVGSSEGMERSRRTSAFYDHWVESQRKDLEAARKAIEARDLDRLGTVVETSCFKLHAVTMTAQPPLLYLEPTTLAVIDRVWDLRQQGLSGYVTIDAGPQVKVLCDSQSADDLAAELKKVPGVLDALIERPGPGLEILP
jgi:diphosphomevalonate decarboxylase